jgi:hypothetical protein
MDRGCGAGETIKVTSPDECIFYHSFDLPSFGHVRGHWDLRGRFDEYIGGEKLSGRRVLDVGTASGFLSFEAERCGASVVSFDAESAGVWDRLPFPGNLAQRDFEAWKRGADEYLLKWKKSYWLAHREFQSSARTVYGNVYEMPSSLGTFDVVIIGQVLVHLRDVIRALASVAARCGSTMIIAEGMINDNKNAFSQFLGRADNPDYDYGFWHHSTGLYIELMKILGFRLRQSSTAKYWCQVDAIDTPITTLIFDRA